MPSRGRQSTVAPTPDPSSQRPSTANAARSTIALPPYQPPLYPLNPQGRTALGDLERVHNPGPLLENLTRAAGELADRAADLNEFLAVQEARAAKRHERRARGQQATEDMDDEFLENQRAEDQRKDAELKELREKVKTMTARMEQATQKTINSQKGTQNLHESLREISSNQVSSTNTPTQTQTQTQRSRRRRASSTESGNLSPIHAQLDHTQPSEDQNIPPLVTALSGKIHSRTEAYDALNLRAKYSQHPYYVNFKGVVHAAAYPEDNGPPVPHARYWFDVVDGGSPPPADNHEDVVMDEDSDIEIARANISTTCPITLCELIDPIKSSKCPHIFERSAITDMINAQRNNTTRGMPIQTTVQCPMPGCDANIGMGDLVPDAVVFRRIKRAQKDKGRNAHRYDDDADDSQLNRQQVEEVDSESGDDIDDIGRRNTQIKKDGDNIEDDF